MSASESVNSSKFQDNRRPQHSPVLPTRKYKFARGTLVDIERIVASRSLVDRPVNHVPHLIDSSANAASYV